MDTGRVWLRKARNALASLAVLGLMGLLAGFVGLLVAGRFGFAAAFFLAMFLSFAALRHQRLLIRGGRPLTLAEAPALYAILAELCRRADLPFVPRLVYLPSPALTAFTTGEGEAAQIVVTEGLLRTLTPEELRGVLAHEVSHIANNDLALMALGGVFLQLTSLFSRVGVFLLLFNIPLLLAMGVHIPWGALWLLAAAPALSSLLILALSRTREYDADLDAARLCGSPEGLISALIKIERGAMSFWERLFRIRPHESAAPAFLQTHPPTEDRIRRLREVEAEPGVCAGAFRDGFAGGAFRP